jgi:hypothetical protein
VIGAGIAALVRLASVTAYADRSTNQSFHELSTEPAPAESDWSSIVPRRLGDRRRPRRDGKFVFRLRSEATVGIKMQICVFSVVGRTLRPRLQDHPITLCSLSLEMQSAPYRCAVKLQRDPYLPNWLRPDHWKVARQDIAKRHVGVTMTAFTTANGMARPETYQSVGPSPASYAPG